MEKAMVFTNTGIKGLKKKEKENEDKIKELSRQACGDNSNMAASSLLTENPFRRKKESQTSLKLILKTSIIFLKTSKVLLLQCKAILLS